MRTKMFFVVPGVTALSLLAFAGLQEPTNPKVGGATMSSTQDIVTNAAASPVHKTLVAAVQAAGLAETLKGEGPFTVFAPTDAAFAALPSGTVEELLKPESKEALTKVLTYHVVPGRLDSVALKQAITDGGGTASLKTVAGGNLTATLNGPTNVVISDESGNTASISTYDVVQSNGIIHVVDAVLRPQ